MKLFSKSSATPKLKTSNNTTATTPATTSASYWQARKRLINYALSLAIIGGFALIGTTLMYQGRAAAPAVGEDTIAPTVAIAQPTDNTKLKSDLIVQATASDNVVVTKLELMIDDKVIHTVNYKDTIGYTLSTSKLTSGNHTISVTAYDGAGNASSASVKVSE